jgi:uncharacterized protein
VEPARTLPGRMNVDVLALSSHHHFRLTSGERPDTFGAGIPVHVLIGIKARPCLALVAGVHGDEYDGILALHGVARELIPSQLQGSLIVIPVANPFAFAHGRRRTPEDDKDLNRVFPGAPRGSLSDRLAHRLCQDILRSADLVFTLHGAMSDGLLAPWIEFLEGSSHLEQATRAAAAASGFHDLIALPRLAGTLQTAMAELGVPVIEGEVGGQGTTTRENVAYYRSRVASVTHHLGILGSEPAGTTSRPRSVWHLCAVDAPAGGIFVRAVELRQPVRVGDRLGTILDVHGDPVSEVCAPADGVIGGHRVHTGVRPGERLVTLWCPVADGGHGGRGAGQRASAPGPAVT